MCLFRLYIFVLSAVWVPGKNNLVDSPPANDKIVESPQSFSARINLENVIKGSSVANKDLLLTSVDSFSSRYDPTWFPK